MVDNRGKRIVLNIAGQEQGVSEATKYCSIQSYIQNAEIKVVE